MSDIAIIGAGLIGSALAASLGERGASVTVIDPDLEGTFSSSELNAGGVRATWRQPLNIELSKRTIEYLAAHAADVGYRPVGYLWLHRPETMPEALRARETQLAHGWEVDAWDVPALRRHAPFIDKTDDLAGAVFGRRDGLVNPNRLKEHLRARARAAGVKFVDRRLLAASERARCGARWRLGLRALPDAPGAEAKRAALTGQALGGAEDLAWIEAEQVVNCAGAWAPDVARALGYACPSQPVRRQVCLFDSREVDLTPYGMTIDPSGVYFHPEATNGMAGLAVPEPSSQSFAYDGESFFEERIWPELYARATGFERLRHLTGWAGLYEVSPDHSAIIGPAGEGSGLVGAWEAHSFSGHGVMHSVAVGELLAARISTGAWAELDLSPFAAARFGRPGPADGLRETAVI